MAWGDTTSEGYALLLLDFCGSENCVVSSPYEPTFDENHINGGIVVELCLCDSSVCNIFSDAFVDKGVKLFISASLVGHWPICSDLSITKPLFYSEVILKVHDLSRVN